MFSSIPRKIGFGEVWHRHNAAIDYEVDQNKVRFSIYYYFELGLHKSTKIIMGIIWKPQKESTNHGKVILRFGRFQSELETEIGLSAWKKSGLIPMYDDQDIHEPDIIIDDYEIPTSSQSMTNELLCLDLNDSFSERKNSISFNRNLKQSSISNYFTKK